MLLSGIDLHKRDLVIATVDAVGTVIDQRRLRASPAAVLQYFRRLPGPHHAVVEATGSWYWIADLPRAHEIDLTLGHAKRLKAISEAKVRTDKVDSLTLAHLLRADLIPEAHMISAELRALRDVMRARLTLVTKRTSTRDSISRLLEKYNVASTAALPTWAQLQARCFEEQIELLTRQIKDLEHALLPELLPTAAVQRLLWIPGLGKINAFTIYLEIDAIERFADVRIFLSYARPVPGSDNSGGRTRHKRSKEGNRCRKLAFSHAAVRAIQYYPEIKSFYKKQLRRNPKAMARGMVAKELGRIVYFVPKSGEPYNGIFKGKALSRCHRTPRTPARQSPPRFASAGRRRQPGSACQGRATKRNAPAAARPRS
jgi:transposase